VGNEVTARVRRSGVIRRELSVRLRIATCQFPVSGDIGRNLRYVLRQMRAAKARGAAVVHFSESALSGGAGDDFPSFRGYDWNLLRACTREVLRQARALRVWVVLGSAHPLSGLHKPHNCLYLIDDRGDLVDRYDKRFLVGSRTALEHRHYTPGSCPVLFTLKGVRCALLICHEWRYPELYRQYQAAGAQVVFHSWYDGALAPRKYAAEGALLGEVIVATARERAANNAVWISAANTCRRESCFPAMVVRPDGGIAGRLHRNRAGALVSVVDTASWFPDPSRCWRMRAFRGVLHSGTLIRDERSEDRTAL
jgi:predicted amidohydrolase